MGDFDRADPMDETLLIMTIIFKQNFIYLPKIQENKLRNDFTWKRGSIGWESCPQVGSPVVNLFCVTLSSHIYSDFLSAVY